MSDEVKPAKPRNCRTEGKQMGLVADLPQSWHRTVFLFLASCVPVLIYWGLGLVEFYHTSIRSHRLSEVCQFKPDIIFINLVMRVINRLTATQQMSLLATFNGVTIIALSARVFDFEQQQSRHAGDHGFLSKPVVKTDLLETLRSHLMLEWVYQKRESSSVFSSLDSGFDKQQSSVASPAQKVSVTLVPAFRGIVERATRREARDYQQRLPAVTHLRQLVKGFKAQQILECVT
ncbi:response regulator [Microcoleus sp. FACHB-672]|uniref:response regulator n=1 Tax=Microcoleus sp. FACHB-672 TaxID=2692825 RepID=UPI001688F27A|nr:response regulator [Microcoleus sp. FACHB-672]MBD2042627.1 response regulator [Microcoleus sp. FACHB-672]